MKKYRLFLLGFISVSWVFLSGFNKSVVSQNEAKQKNTLAKQAVVKGSNADKTGNDAGKEKQRSLDLSVPLEDSDLSGQNNKAADNEEHGLFANESKKQVSPIELKGGWVTSPEPEVEKRKSVDGAGIVIDLKQ